MTRRLARQWFLVLTVLGALAVAFLPWSMRWTEWLDTTVCCTIGIFLPALCLESRRLARAVIEPPALAWVTGFLMPQEDYRIGLILVASGPCTLASAVIWTRLAGGDDATALLVTMITNGLSWLTTTAWLALTTGVAASAGNAFDMMLRLALVLVVPVILAQSLRAAPKIARLTTHYKIEMSVVSRLLILAVMLKAALEARDRLVEGTATVSVGWLPLVALACVGVHLIALVLALWGGKFISLDRPRRIAAAISGSQKTLPVALVLFDAYFPGYPLAILPLVFYHFGQLIADTVVAGFLAHRHGNAV
jgi:sodium/bile acid cotransporter 7